MKDIYRLHDIAQQYDGSLITEDQAPQAAAEVARELDVVKRLHESRKPEEPINPQTPIKPWVL